MLVNYYCSCLILLHIVICKGQFCMKLHKIVKTRVQYVPGQRVIARSDLFGSKLIKENYNTTKIKNYHDYERIYVCCEGYTEVEGKKCEPVCNPSCPNNTHCIRPNICECDFGYRGYTASAINIQCEAFCNPACDPNAECVGPYKCVCKPGYEDVNDSGKCVPICKTDCPENSNCTKPDECTCNPGYLDNGWGKCVPECKPQCPEFSDCIEPNTCNCHENYKAEHDKCKPICEQTCSENAECVRPNECECLAGYVPIENMSNSSFRCEPVCKENCTAFAFCAKPNTCECEQGYNETEQYLCEPLCENGCPEHSTCSAPNTCTCDQGYNMLEQQCQPVCEKACPQYSICSEPNKCLCDSGYQLKLSSIYNLYCEPVCPSNCSTFGKCVQPNKCECLAGYEMDELETCRPICSKGCKNGLCFQPEICICKPGYLMGPQDECEPVCSKVCQNGSCIEPEICQCHEGYKLANNSINLCEPVCETACINGICVAPNVCICHENFIPQPTETGLNHSNCQVLQTTTTTEKITTIFSEIKDLNNHNSTLVTRSLTTSVRQTTKSIPDVLQHTSSKPLVAAHVCNDLCQCWQEYDELGALTFQKCAHLCADEFDEPCLDLKLCQCDLTKNQLVCRANEEDLYTEDPIYYECKMPRPAVTTFKPLEDGAKSDMNSAKPTEKSNFVWWPIIVAVLITLCLLGVFVHFYFRKPAETLIEYEL